MLTINLPEGFILSSQNSLALTSQSAAEVELPTLSPGQQGELGVRGLKQVKFYSPLFPDERADVVLVFNGAMLNFRVMRSEQTIAQGAFEIAPVLNASAIHDSSPAGELGSA